MPTLSSTLICRAERSMHPSSQPQNLFKRKRGANNVDKTMKLKISIKSIKTEYSELEALQRCVTLEKECFEMLEYLQN